MGLYSCSIQLVFYPCDTVEIKQQIITEFGYSDFRIEELSNDQGINYIELISMNGEKESDIDENKLKEKLVSTASILKNLSSSIREYIRENDLHILIGGWSPNDDQITNLIIPYEFNAETSALRLSYEFCLNDYHD